MTLRDNRRLARRALDEIYARGNVELAGELIHPDFVDHEPGHPEGPAGRASVRRTVEHLRRASADLSFAVEDEVAEGDKVVQLVTMSGRHTGPLVGGEPSGRRFSGRHVYIWRVADGKLIEHWGSRDDLGPLQQLGLLPGG